MKFLLLLAVIGIALWIWRSGRVRSAGAAKPTRPPPAAAAQEMLACSVCGMHVPKSDALAGRLGVYCSESHRHSAEP